MINIINPQNQEVQQTPSTRNKMKIAPRFIVIQFLKINDKEKILEAPREKKMLHVKEHMILKD